MLKLIKTSYEEARKKKLCPELGLVGSLDVDIRSESNELDAVRSQALDDLKSQGTKVKADYVFVNRASYVFLTPPEMGIFYFIDGEARQKLKKD